MNIPRSEVLRRYGYVFVVLIATDGLRPCRVSTRLDAGCESEDESAAVGVSDN